jgi:hypothetical protein
MKWLPVAVLAVIGLIAAFVAIEYVTVPIHNLPSYIPGRRAVNGHYHVRAAFVGLVAIVALVASAILAIRIVKPPAEKPETTPEPPVTGTSAAQLLGSPPVATETTDAE